MTDKFWDEDLKIKEEVTIGWLMKEAIGAKCDFEDVKRSGLAKPIIEFYRGRLQMIKSLINTLFPDYSPAIRIGKDEEDGKDVIIVENSQTGEVLYEYKRVI